jgi:hypothetical protein
MLRPMRWGTLGIANLAQVRLGARKNVFDLIEAEIVDGRNVPEIVHQSLGL